VLEIRGVRAGFGSLRVLEDVGLVVPPATSMGLIGPNGAGKTTLLNVVSGFVRPLAGELRLDGRDLGRMSAPERSRAGVGRTFQTPVLFAGLTLAQSLRVTARQRSRDAGRTSAIGAPDVLALTGLTAVAERSAEGLTGYERRLAEIARALMLAPHVLLLDEPASGLRESEIDELAGLINMLRERYEISTLVVSHDMALVRGCCPVVTVLHEGQVLSSGPAATVLREPAVVEAYFGAENVDAYG